ncbi:toll-interacting protein B-like isoform X2 [Galleria mellonella]|uniref:Toll-interacting protein B-like isoform X2 n=1 Tax=Galleria mellonella TaxID=7137 RepID=A0A6J1WKX6_GALME|nr:toll-interacting protein B-like isoform X2 [Galleria mellonella]
MTSTLSDDRNEERRRRVLLGPLPAGFLRTDGATETVDADYQAALALQQQLSGTAQLPGVGTPYTARLSITIAQAKLVKNYGLTRMDPYVRMRVGHCIYETHTDPSGGKTPRWNKVVHCLLPPGVNSIYLEIFDECSFTMDELIAWAHITIPPAVLNGETHEDWFPLNGKQGDGMEGMINLVLSYTVGPAPVTAFPPVLVVPSTGMGGYAAMPMYPAQQAYPQPQPHQQPQQQPLQQPPITAEQLQQIEEMFPSMDKEVIKSVLEANHGNKDATINSLLQMSE